jgi:hypothetical protein
MYLETTYFFRKSGKNKKTSLKNQKNEGASIPKIIVQ